MAGDEGGGSPGKPARSGADTPRSSPLIAHGGKVDLDALRRAVHQRGVQPATDPGPVSPPNETRLLPASDDDVAGPIITDATDAVPASSAGGSAADDDAPNRVVFVLQRDLQSRLDKYLVSRISFMSRSQLQRLIDEGGVTVNGRAPKASTKLRLNDRVEVFVPPPPATDIQPQQIPLHVLFEDDHIIVLNKQPDIIVHPARSHLTGTLINALAWHFSNVSGGALSQVGKEFARPGVVHRLDRDTSGLIVFAKNDEAHWRMARQFETRTVDKRYIALVHGVFEPEIDAIDLPLGPHPSKEKGYREKVVVRHDHLGKPSLTIARLREAFPMNEEKAEAAGGSGAGGAARRGHGPRSRNDGSANDPARGFSLVELELKTGRTHQIRVHLSHLGFPIVGDDMYGGIHALTPNMLDTRLSDLSSKGDEGALLARQALHATTLSFKHPMTQEPMAFQAPFPSDMGQTLAALRRASHGHRSVSPPGCTIDVARLT